MYDFAVMKPFVPNRMVEFPVKILERGTLLMGRVYCVSMNLPPDGFNVTGVLPLNREFFVLGCWSCDYCRCYDA